jgi:LAS superfamily LD-carboxypeptidase LdcB
LLKPDKKLLRGESADHVVEISVGTRIHREMVTAFEKFQSAAATAGFDLQIASGFRDYASQLKIWNEKALGKRVLLDDRGEALEYARLSPEKIVNAILRWSALPGASRHHWGTDIDVFDKKVTDGGYRLRLVPQEAEANGPFATFSRWLETEMAAHGFFRPYAVDRGGVSPEWWHLSYAPLSQSYYDAFDLALFRQTIDGSTMELKAVVQARLPEIFQKYVRNINPPKT